MENIPNEKCLRCVLDCKKTMKDNVEDCKRYYPTPIWSLFEEYTKLKNELKKFKLIDEEGLNKFAKDESEIYGLTFADASHKCQINREAGFYDGFKAGYRKAKEE